MSRKPKSRFFRRVLVLGLLMLIGIGCLPMLVAHSPLRQSILPYVLPELQGTSEVGEASLGWFSPIEMRDVVLLDTEGRKLLEAPRVITESSMLGLLLDSDNIGLVRLEQPQLQVVMRRDGSNFEDVIGPLLFGPAEEEPSSLTQLKLEFVEGQIALHDESGERGELSDFNLVLKYDASQTQDLTWTTQGLVKSAGAAEEPKSFNIEGQLSTENYAGQVTLKSDHLSLASLEPLAGRFAEKAELQAVLTSDLTIAFERAATGQKVSVLGTATVEQLQMASPGLLADDTINIESLTADMDWSLSGDRLSVRRCSVQSELGDLTAVGELDVRSILRGDFRGLLTEEDYTVEGRIDVAKLANRLPGLLRLRSDTQLTGGELRVAFSSREEAGQRTWQGKLSTTNLDGVARGQAISWREPIQADYKAVQGSEGKVQSELNCSSSFLMASASGTSKDGFISARGDLNRLTTELSRFFDLSDVRLAGHVAMGLDFKPAKTPSIDGVARAKASGYMQLNDFELALPGKRPWREQRMKIVVDGVGVVDGEGLQAVDQASLRLESGGDTLAVNLTGGVRLAEASTSWPLDLRLRGKLATWLPRVQAWLPLEGWQIQGDVDGNIQANVSADSVAVTQSDIGVSQFAVTGHGLRIREPQVTIQGDVVWDVATDKIHSRESRLRTSAIATRTKNITKSTGDDGADSLTGEIVWSANLTQLQQWLQDPSNPIETEWAGQFRGTANLSQTGGVTTAEWDTVLENVAASKIVRQGQQVHRQPVWSERQVSLTGQGQYLAEAATAELSRLELTSETVKLGDIHGKFDFSNGPTQVDLSGNLEYDLPKLMALARPYVGDGLKMEGTGSRAFSLRGTLPQSNQGATVSNVSWSQSLEGQAGFGWTRGDAYGLPIGKGELDAKLEGGQLRVSPLDVAVGGGKLHAAPQFDFSKETPTVALPAGRVIENVELSPELCQSWLQFVAPLLADATRADGTFSLDLTYCVVPITMAKMSEVRGTLAIDSARVRPGPLAEQLIFVGRQVEAIVRKQPLGGLAAAGNSEGMMIPKQNLNFAVSQGRVHHRDLTFQVGDVTVKTTGSVGLDSSLEMTAEIPIQQAWLGNDPLLRSLAGKTISVPIRGTLNKPKLDARALDDLTKQLVGSAAQGLLDDAINQGLNGLFGKPKK